MTARVVLPVLADGPSGPWWGAGMLQLLSSPGATSLAGRDRAVPHPSPPPESTLSHGGSSLCPSPRPALQTESSGAAGALFRVTQPVAWLESGSLTGWQPHAFEQRRDLGLSSSVCRMGLRPDSSHTSRPGRKTRSQCCRPKERLALPPIPGTLTPVCSSGTGVGTLP